MKPTTEPDPDRAAVLLCMALLVLLAAVLLWWSWTSPGAVG